MDHPVSDTSRGIHHEPDRTWPAEVKVQLIWVVGGRPHVRTHLIDGDLFFGRNGAPMEGAALIAHIERMRREGPPPVSKAKRDLRSQKANKYARQSRR